MAEVISGKILRDSTRLTLTQDAIFDRIINVQFIRQNDETFTLRSDYEIVFDKAGNYVFKKCSVKPDISISYTQVNNNTAISVKLNITNFHIQSAINEPSNEKFSAGSNPIVRVIIQLGYFNQFPVFTDPRSGLTKEDYYNLLPRTENDLFRTIDCRVLGIYPVKLPPDGVTLFDCVVGNIEVAFHSAQDRTDTSIAALKKGITLQDYLYEMITRRYPRGYVPQRSLFLDNTLAKTVTQGSGANEVTFDYTGPMLRESADKYGVKCFLSPMAAETAFKDGNGREMNVIPPLPQLPSVTAAFFHMQEIFPALRYLALPSGNYVVYHKDENATSIAASLREQGEVKPVQSLPAIYTITYSGLRVITCPFTTLVTPFQELSFSSTYNLGNLISYFYAPEKGNETFYAINCTISFATTGDANVMEILSSDAEGEAQ